MDDTNTLTNASVRFRRGSPLAYWVMDIACSSLIPYFAALFRSEELKPLDAKAKNNSDLLNNLVDSLYINSLERIITSFSKISNVRLSLLILSPQVW